MKSNELLSIISRGHKEWNTWRKTYKKKLDFKNIKDINVNFKECNLESAAFNNSVIPDAKFSRALLNKAVFVDSNLHDAFFIDTELNKANFNYSDLRKAKFNGTKCMKSLFMEANLHRAKFNAANLSSSDLNKADLRRASFKNAILNNTNFYTSNLRDANFRNADLRGACLMLTNLTGVDFSGANLEGANLQGAQLIGTNFEDANLNKCTVFGTSVWQVNLKNCKQEDLIITRQSIFEPKHKYYNKNEPKITVDDLRVAQFIYLLIENPNIRHVIDTITSKVVLILGSFTKDRISILHSLRDELRKYNYIPVLFDFENSSNRNLTETVSTLAHLSHFVIADLTDPKSIPQELERIIPNLPSVPVCPILLENQKEYGMFEHFKNYQWVLDIVNYIDSSDLIAKLNNKIIKPSEVKFTEMKNNKK